MNNEPLKIENDENIEKRIFVIRGIQVMLDSDVAELFGIEVRRINEQMKRNIERFPEDFCFQLNSKEFNNLRSQNAIFNQSVFRRKYLPYVYTEHGIIALAGVLKSDVAAKMSVAIARTFIQMRHFIAENGDVLVKLAQLQNRQINFEIETFIKQYSELEVTNNDNIHDRFLILDESECYSLGASLNYAGKKTFVVTKIEDSLIVNSILKRVKA